MSKARLVQGAPPDRTAVFFKNFAPSRALDKGGDSTIRCIPFPNQGSCVGVSRGLLRGRSFEIEALDMIALTDPILVDIILDSALGFQGLLGLYSPS